MKKNRSWKPFKQLVINHRNIPQVKEIFKGFFSKIEVAQSMYGIF
jgi:hypothetical protein